MAVSKGLIYISVFNGRKRRDKIVAVVKAVVPVLIGKRCEQ